MNEHLKLMKIDELAYGLSMLNAQKRKLLFRKLTEAEKSELKRLNREIKTYQSYLATRQIRMKGF